MMEKKKRHPVSTVGNSTSFVRTARIAGLLYLTIIVFGLFSEIVIRRSLIAPGDAVATAANVLSSPLLFRTGLAADAVMLLSDVAIAILFYVLLKPVNRTLAIMAAAFRLAQASILGANLLNYHAAFLILGGSDYGHLLADDQRRALMMFFLELHTAGYDLALLFFSVSTFLLGYLIKLSNLLPAIFGYALQASAVVYLAGSCCRFLFPQYVDLLQPAYFIPFAAELSFCLWLLIKGVNLHNDL